MSKEPQPIRLPVKNCALRLCQPTVTFADGTVRFVQSTSPRTYSETIVVDDETCLGHHAVKKFYDLEEELRQLAQNPFIALDATKTFGICTAFFCKQNTGRVSMAEMQSFQSLAQV